MKHLLIITTAILLLSSCVTQKKCSERYPCVKSSDTTITRIETVEWHDTIYKFQADSSSLQALIDCSEGKAKLAQILAYTQGKRVNIPVIRLKHDTLIVECKIDSSEVAKSYYNKHTTEFQKISNQAVQIEYRMTTIKAFFFWCGIVAVALTAIYFGFGLAKKYLIK